MSIATYQNVFIPVDYAPCFLNPVGDFTHWAYENNVIARWVTEQFREVKDGDLIGIAAYHMSGIDRVEFYLNDGSPIVVPEAVIIDGVKAFWIRIDENSGLLDSEQCYLSAIVYPVAGKPMVLGAEDTGFDKSPLNNFDYIHPGLAVPMTYEALSLQDIQNGASFTPAPGHYIPLLHGDDVPQQARVASGLGISGDSVNGHYIYVPDKTISGVHALRFSYNKNGSLSVPPEMFVDYQNGDDSNDGLSRQFPKKHIAAAVWAAGDANEANGRKVDGLVINLADGIHYFGPGAPREDSQTPPTNSTRPVTIRPMAVLDELDPPIVPIISGHKFNRINSSGNSVADRKYLTGINLLKFENILFQDEWTRNFDPDNLPQFEIASPTGDITNAAIRKPAPVIMTNWIDNKNVTTYIGCTINNFFSRRGYEGGQGFFGTAARHGRNNYINCTFTHIGNSDTANRGGLIRNCLFDNIAGDIASAPVCMLNCRFNKFGLFGNNPGNLVHSDFIQSFNQTRNTILQNIRPLKSLSSVQTFDDYLDVCIESQGIFTGSPYEKANIPAGKTLAYSPAQYFFDTAIEFVEMYNRGVPLGAANASQLPAPYGLSLDQFVTIDGVAVQGRDMSMNPLQGVLKMGGPYNMLILNSDFSSDWVNMIAPMPTSETFRLDHLNRNSTFLYMENVRKFDIRFDVSTNGVVKQQIYPGLPSPPPFYGSGSIVANLFDGDMDWDFVFARDLYSIKYDEWFANGAVGVFHAGSWGIETLGTDNVRIKFPPLPENQLPSPDALGGEIEFREGLSFTQDENGTNTNSQNTLTNESDTNKIVIRLTGTEYDDTTNWMAINQSTGFRHNSIGDFYTDVDPDSVVGLPTIEDIIQSIIDNGGDPAVSSDVLPVENAIVGGSQPGYGGAYIDIGEPTEYALSTNAEATNVFDVLPQFRKFNEVVRVDGGETFSLLLHANKNEYKQVIGNGNGTEFNNLFYRDFSYIAFNSKNAFAPQISSNQISFRKSFHHTFVPLTWATINGISCSVANGGESTITLNDNQGYFAGVTGNRTCLINSYGTESTTAIRDSIVPPTDISCIGKGMSFDNFTDSIVTLKNLNASSMFSNGTYQHSGQIGGTERLLPSVDNISPFNLPETESMNLRIFNDAADGNKNLIAIKINRIGGTRFFGTDPNFSIEPGSFVRIQNSNSNDGIYEVIAVYNGIPEDTASNTRWGGESEYQYLEVKQSITPETPGTKQNIVMTDVSNLPLLKVKYRVTLE